MRRNAWCALRKLRAMRYSLLARDPLLMRIGAAKTEAGRAFGFVQIEVPDEGQTVNRQRRPLVGPASIHSPHPRNEDPAPHAPYGFTRPSAAAHYGEPGGSCSCNWPTRLRCPMVL